MHILRPPSEGGGELPSLKEQELFYLESERVAKRTGGDGEPERVQEWVVVKGVSLMRSDRPGLDAVKAFLRAKVVPCLGLPREQVFSIERLHAQGGVITRLQDRVGELLGRLEERKKEDPINYGNVTAFAFSFTVPQADASAADLEGRVRALTPKNG